MKWKDLKSYLREHPYYLDASFTMSMSDAAAIIERDGFASFEEMVKGAKTKSGLPEKAWKDFDTVITRRKRKEKNRIPVRRLRLAIAIILVLFTAMLALTPAGRSLAKSMFDMIVQVVTNGLNLININSGIDEFGAIGGIRGKDTVGHEKPYLSLNDPESLAKNMNIENFRNKYSFQIIELDCDTYILTEVIEKIVDNSIILRSTYYNASSQSYIYITQVWGEKQSIRIFSEEEKANSITIFENATIYYDFDAYDGTTSCYATLNDSYFIIGITNKNEVERVILSLIKK